MPEENDRSISIKEIFLCIWSNKWPILAITAAFSILTLLITIFVITPQYQATIRLYVNNKTESATSVNSSDISAAQSLVNTYIAIIQSDSALEAVSESAGLTYTPKELKTMISASSVNNTEVFSVSVTGPSPEECAGIANTIADIAPDKIAAIVEGSSVRVIDYAQTPTLPVSPSIPKNTAVAALLGFALSCMLFIVLYLFDTTITTESEIKEICDLPILGIISDFKAQRSDKHGYSKYYYYARKAEDK